MLHLMERFEYVWFALGCTLVALALPLPRIPHRWVRPFRGALRRAARRPVLASALAGGASLLLSAGFAWLRGMPVPAFQDEFSYLLAADTFARGRLTNPAHPLWVHFESFHVLSQPTYASQYPPGQGLMLAWGQSVFGHPAVGAWLGVALACAALVWMLRAWLPARWSLVGGLLAAFHPLCAEWSQSYWGGGLALTGGALVLGGVRRIADEPRAHDAFLAGVGIALLAVSRPFEGGALTIFAAGALLLRRGAARPPGSVLLRRVVLPLLAVLVPLAGAMGAYNRAVTGNPLQMPYLLYARQYDRAPLFLFQRAAPSPGYRNREMRDFYDAWQIGYFQRQRASFVSVARGTIYKAYKITLTFWAFPVFLAALGALPPVLRRDERARSALAIGLLFLLVLLPETWMNPHYAAPVMPLLFALALMGLRRLPRWRPFGLPLGRRIVGAIPLLCVGPLLFVAAIRGRPDPEHDWAKERARIERALATSFQATGERSLVLVRYGPGHSCHHEWVYNRADLNAAPVVWARELPGAAGNRRLLNTYRDRRVWLLVVGGTAPYRLSRYPADDGERR